MFTNFRFAAAATIASLAAFPHVVEAGASAWHFDYINYLINTRLDPIVSPDKPSGHAHSIYGGSNFASSYSYKNSVASNCSTIFAQHDKGNYWAPLLYATEDDANAPINKYTVVRSNQRYYAFLDRAIEDEPVEAPPEGLRFIVGNMSAKSYEETGVPLEALIYTCQTAGADISTNVLSDNFNFDRHCPELKVELRSPSCWDGVNLYSKNNSHMAYPLQILYGPCPFDHPHRIPAFMFEWTFKVGEVLPAGKSFKDHFIWASGDTTGYGFHADFTMGWDRDVLTKALNDPACLPGHSIPAEECPSLGIDKEADIERARACKPANGHVEEAGTTWKDTVDKLPGCNLPWKSGPKPTCSEAPPMLNIQSFLGVTADPLIVPDLGRDVKAAGAPKDVWERVGCLDEYVLDLGNKTGWHEYNTMTNERCHDFCAEIGSPYAATATATTAEGQDTIYSTTPLLQSKVLNNQTNRTSRIEAATLTLRLSEIEARSTRTSIHVELTAKDSSTLVSRMANTVTARTKFSRRKALKLGSLITSAVQREPTGIDLLHFTTSNRNGTFEPKPAANVASTGFSSVPTTSGGSVETGPAVVGNAVQLAVATTSHANAASSATGGVATARLPGVNNMAIDTDNELGSRLGSVIAQSTDAPTRASSSHRQHHYTPCAVVTKTVTVTVKASDAGQRHLQRRSRQHMFDTLT
ncbi:hypothetical protein QFC21_000870 [Naganishia friedmannii]|uniref:Uncharacterized protein n=1 Tax=Naganishia friedmannii TaxID=89922 RepID=A0ACC2W898_9TREE|nr:hypothetical protein QFC21_000870 [Naganishia friedmannii]